MSLEYADIESIEFGGHDSPVVRVRGYQNYDITATSVAAMHNPRTLRPWTDNKVKAEFFETILDKIRPKTYADFGSNLGYYVFHAAFRDIESHGIDYNSEYTCICDAIKSRFNFSKTTFENNKLEFWSESKERFDLLTVFNVIHHLYNRTEQYKDMRRLVRDFARKGSCVLFEFPTEHDKKGYKWTMDTDYSKALFEDSINEEFDMWEPIPGQTKERPYYLCYG
jgi:hypothetical protein